MANNLTAVISADTTRFTRAINEAQSVLSRYARKPELQAVQYPLVPVLQMHR